METLKETSSQNPYDAEFVTEILNSKKQAEEDKTTIIAVEDLWK